MNFEPRIMMHTAVIVNVGTEKSASIKSHPYAIRMASIPNAQQPTIVSEQTVSVLFHVML